MEGLISLAEEPTPSMEGLISLAEEPTPSVEELISIAEEPTPSVELISLGEEPTPSSRATISINSTMYQKPTVEPEIYQFKNVREPPVEAPYAPLIGAVSILVMAMEVAFVIILDFKAYQAALECIKRNIQSWLRMENCEDLVENGIGLTK